MLNDNFISKYSEMEKPEREFVIKQIQKYKPKKILTVGIAAGVNEVLILDYLDKNDLIYATKLYSIDYNTIYYRDLYSNAPNPRKSGFLVEELIPHLQQYWSLYTPGITASHIEKIGGDIDFCIIDTVHSAPGEALDFLMVLPFLSDNAIIIMHDLVFQCFWDKHSNICALLFMIFDGQKEFPKPYPYTPYGIGYDVILDTTKDLCQNIGSCQINKKHYLSDDFLDKYFKIFLFPWTYIPKEVDLEIFKNFIAKHFQKKYLELFEEAIKMQYKWTADEEKEQNKYRDQEINKIKNYLSYKLGNLLIKHPFTFVFRVARVYREWKRGR
ncbi:class I SAM-dependent methyltransferase [Campylobacter jejuni]|nr:class I SAM-dependent methyltransferase [Campylobacter jejuni]